MTRHPTGPRAVLMAAGVAAAAMGAAHAEGISGTVAFEGGAVIPEGHVEIYLDDPALQDGTRRRATATGVESDGKARTIGFSLPASAPGSPATEIVALLERADGWLVARGSTALDSTGLGSTGLDGGAPVHIILNPAIY